MIDTNRPLRMHKFDLIILAGGRGQRAGGIDKGIRPYKGSTPCQHISNTLAAFRKDAPVISCNRNFDHYRTISHRLVSDAQPDCGPLSGVASAADLAQDGICLIIACDLTEINTQLIDHLLENYPSNGACHASDTNGHHLLCLCTAQHLHIAAKLINTGNRRFRAWLDQIESIAVDCSAFQANLLNRNQ